jgi:hypothetical protein
MGMVCNKSNRYNIMEQKEPVIIFQDDDQFMEYLRYWQNNLFLNDWIIKGKLCSFDELNNPENPDKSIIHGDNSINVTCKTAYIRVLGELPNYDNIAKFCAEKTLLHQLLRCKYAWMDHDPDQYADCYVHECELALLEQMAKTLIMVKYELPFEFFYND